MTLESEPSPEPSTSASFPAVTTSSSSASFSFGVAPLLGASGDGTTYRRRPRRGQAIVVLSVPTSLRPLILSQSFSSSSSTIIVVIIVTPIDHHFGQAYHSPSDRLRDPLVKARDRAIGSTVHRDRDHGPHDYYERHRPPNAESGIIPRRRARSNHRNAIDGHTTDRIAPGSHPGRPCSREGPIVRNVSPRGGGREP